MTAIGIEGSMKFLSLLLAVCILVIKVKGASSERFWGTIVHRNTVELDSPQITIRRRKDAICLPDNYGVNTHTHTHIYTQYLIKGKSNGEIIPLQARCGPEGG